MAGLRAMCGQRRQAHALLAELQETARKTPVPPFAFAFAALGFGDDGVYEWMEKAIDTRDPIATHLPSMPLYDSIRADPRFAALLRRMNLGFDVEPSRAG
jgi:hypothetical protein